MSNIIRNHKKILMHETTTRYSCIIIPNMLTRETLDQRENSARDGSHKIMY